MGLRAWMLGLALAFAPLPALADTADFLGVWTPPPDDASQTSRVVVSPGTGDRLQVHLFGRCRPQACDWGTAPARLDFDGPDRKVLGLIVAEFDTVYGHERLAMRPAVGHALRIEIEFDFKDDGLSAKDNVLSSFVTTGAFAYAGNWNEGPRVAANAAPSSVSASPGENKPVAVPYDEKSSDAGFLGGLIGLGPKVPDGYAPAPGEDCQPFAPTQVRVSNTNGEWRLGDFSRTLSSFLHREDAARGLALLNHYHFDEQCFVTHESKTMLYWKRAGVVPKESLKGELCVAVDPTAIKAEEHDGTWSVGTGMAALLDFGDDKAAAERAVSVIRTYHLAKQCFAGPPRTGLQYWLAQ